MAFHRLKTASAALLTGVLIAFSSAPQQGSAQAEAIQPMTAENVVAQFHATLVNVMKEAESLGYEGRFKWLTPAVRDTFNLPFMAQIAAGIYWAKASDDERRRYIEAFSKMSTATYAARFNGFSGEKFDILSAEPEGQTSVVVRSEITGSDGGHTAISYLMREFGGSWKIVDVYLNGSVSELAVKKSDYSGVLKTGGMEGLIKALDDKVAEIARIETRSAAKKP